MGDSAAVSLDAAHGAGVPGVDAALAAQPAAMVAAAAQLDAIAEQVEAARAAHAGVLHAAPAGAEEVSVMVARTQATVADSFELAAVTGVQRLREAADALRVQAAEYASTDASGGAALAPLY